MIVKEHIAKMKTCILIAASIGRIKSNRGDNCAASDCFAYWRWIDDGKQEGYCSLGGKPEF